MQIKKREIISILVFAILFFVLSFPGFSKYIIITCFASALLMITRKNIKKKYLIILYPCLSYVAIGLASSIINGFFTSYTIKQIIFLLLPALSAVGIYSFYDGKNIDIVKVVFWATFCCTLKLIPSFNKADLLESTYCFIYGIFSIYFFQSKSYKYFFLALLMMILSHKRIVYLAVVMCIFLLYSINKINSIKIKKKICFLIDCSIVLGAFLFIKLLGDGELISFFHINNINSMGREYIWSRFAKDYTFDLQFLGKGMGYVLFKLNRLNLGQFSGNLHSDLLASYIELGFFGFGAWLISYISMIKKIKSVSPENLKKHILLTIFLVFLIINYFTDNILIYIEFWFSFDIILLNIISNER